MPRPVPDDQIEPIRAAVFAGRKIEAIKRYRTATGEGLKEAKDFIEALEAEMRRTEPGKFTAPPGGKGCATVLCLLILVGVLIAKFI